MLSVIYGVPTAGKTFTLEKLIEMLGISRGSVNPGRFVLVDSDDILARVTMASTEIGYRINDFDYFWDYWRNASEEVHARGETIVRSIANAYQKIDDVYYILFTNLQTIKPDIAFARTFSSLMDIWREREEQKNVKRKYPRDVSDPPAWMKDYSPYDYQPGCPLIVLGDGEYMFDHIDDIRKILPW